MVAVAIVAAGAGAIAAGTSAYAASTQADAAENAANTQAKAADRASEVQRQLYEQSRQDLAPYREVGQRTLGTLQDLAGQYSGGPGLSVNAGLPQPYSPEQFTGQIDLFRDPSYQFRVNEGLRAIEHRAASRGQLQSGNTLKDLTRFGQEAASQEYGNAYQRSLLTNQQRAQLGQQGYGNQLQSNQLGYGRGIDLYGLERQRTIEDQRNRFNQYQMLTNYGVGAAGQQIQANQQLGSQLGENILGRGNALAAGQIGAANAFAGGVQGVAGAGQGALNNYLTLRLLGLGGGGSSTGYGGPAIFGGRDY